MSRKRALNWSFMAELLLTKAVNRQLGVDWLLEELRYMQFQPPEHEVRRQYFLKDRSYRGLITKAKHERGETPQGFINRVMRAPWSAAGVERLERALQDIGPGVSLHRRPAWDQDPPPNDDDDEDF